jgi:AMP nucleosidase
MPLTPDGVKTEASDRIVTDKFTKLHLQIGIEAMTEIEENGEQIKHFRY